MVKNFIVDFIVVQVDALHQLFKVEHTQVLYNRLLEKKVQFILKIFDFNVPENLVIILLVDSGEKALAEALD